MIKNIIKANAIEMYDGDIKILPLQEEVEVLKAKFKILKEEHPENMLLIELCETTATKMQNITCLLEQRIISLENIESLLRQYVEDNAATQKALRTYLKEWG